MTRNALALIAAVSAMVNGGASASAQVAPPPSRVTLEQVLQILDERSPRTVAERATIDVAAADRITADALPNPSVSYGGTRLVSGYSTGAVTQHQFVIDQPLLLFGQRQTRRALANANVSVERARVATTLSERRLEVRRAFASLVARQEELRILRDSQTELERIAHVVRGRAEAGDSSQYDVLRIETENRSLQVEVMNAATNVEDASGHLAALLGFPEWLPEADGTLTPGNVPTDLDVLWTHAQQTRPALAAVRQRQYAAQGTLALAHRERMPVPSISAGTIATHEVTGTSVFFGLSTPLALFDRNRGPIARAAAEVEAERLAGDAEIAEARAEIERTRKTLLSRSHTLLTLEGDVIQRLPDLRRMAEEAYREGKGGILELLDASRSLKEIRLLHVRQLEMTKLAEEDLISAAGLDVREARP